MEGREVGEPEGGIKRGKIDADEEEDAGKMKRGMREVKYWWEIVCMCLSLL
jgi:hypothetical protein